jgi:outer membrane murein-binding lipoprotein Lpp
MTTYSKGPPPETASAAAAPPDQTPRRTVALRRALVVAALAALLVGVLSAAGATYLAGGPTDEELEGSIATLTAQVDSLAEQAGTLTAQAGTLTVQVDGLAAEKADLAEALNDTRAQVDSLGEENAALRAEVADLTPDMEPPAAEVTFGSVSKATRILVPPGDWDERPGLYRIRPKGSFLLFVDVTVTNPDGVDDAWFSSLDVELKGPDDTTYALVQRSKFRLPEPVHWGQLEDLMLGPSETVKGVLVFYVPEPATEFTITYDGATTDLSL